MFAMILAAGRGERMRPLTDHTPKPLLQAGGKPLIVWHIERLVAAGITDLLINHAHLGAQIEAALGDGSQFGAHIQYSPEVTALETAGGIVQALPLLGNEVFAVVNGDIFCDYDFACLPVHAAQMQQRGDLAHLVLVDNPAHHPNGDFLLFEGRVRSAPPDGTTKQSTKLANNASQVAAYPSLPLSGEELKSSPSVVRFPPDKGGLRGGSLLTFSGIGLYRPSLFAHIPRGTKAPLAPLLRQQIALDTISGEHHRGVWLDIGTPQRLHDLDTQLRHAQ